MQGLGSGKMWPRHTLLVDASGLSGESTMVFFRQKMGIATTRQLCHPFDSRLLCGCSDRLSLAARTGTAQAGKAESVLFRKIFCILFDVGKGISKRRQFFMRNYNTAVCGLHSKDRCGCAVPATGSRRLCTIQVLLLWNQKIIF